jgi:hypothetical protein
MSSSDIELRDVFEVATIEGASPQEIRAWILRIESYMKTMKQIELQVKHHFAKGLYGRELFLPKGTRAIGKIHKREHLSVISKGAITVLTEEDGLRRIIAPYTFVSQPGTKRLVIAHTDTIWNTIHATNETDLEKIEADVIATSYEAFDELAFNQNLQILMGGV